MKVYKRRVSNKFDTFFSEGGETIIPKSVQIYLTQSIEDIGIYEDVDMTAEDNDDELNTDK